MTRERRALTVVIQPDRALTSRTFRVPLWRLWAAGGGLLLLLLTAIGMAALYGPITATAAKVPGLKREIARLQEDNAKIRQLAAALDSVEAGYAQLRRMIGADIVPVRVELSSSVPTAPAVFARAPNQRPKFGSGVTRPRYWPLDEPGYVTRGRVGSDGQEEPHPGLDIAVPVGRPVRAVAAGRVAQASRDPEYGEFVAVEHPERFESMYGHLSRILVRVGQKVEAGEVIGLSGNSGRSSAPHLHLEIRRGGQIIDPMTLVKENR